MKESIQLFKEKLHKCGKGIERGISSFWLPLALDCFTEILESQCHCNVVPDYHPFQRVQRTCTIRDPRRLFIADDRRESRRVVLAVKSDTGQNKAACVDGIPQGVAPHTLARISRLTLTLKLRDAREKHAHL